MIALDQLSFDAASHTYRYCDKPIPAVSDVLECSTDFSHIDFDTLQAAQEYGSHVHAAVELHLTGQLDHATLDPALLGCVSALDTFLADAGVEIIYTERQVVSSKHWYAGTLDAIGCRVLDGKHLLIDWKTGSSLPKVVGLQTAAYRLALAETDPYLEIHERWCVRLFADGTYRATELKDPQDAFVFKNARNVWYFNHGY